MNKIMYFLFISIFTVEWVAAPRALSAVNVSGRIVAWTPDILALVAMVLVMAVIAQRRELALPFRYGMFLLAFLLITVGWAVVSGVSSGVLLAGMRSYLKYLPFFLLPLAYRFSETQIRRQLLVLLGLSLLQLPVVLYQRFIQFADKRTGDVITGTLGGNASGILSVYLACAIAIVVAFYVKGRIGIKTVVPIVLLLALPMMLNETKISLLLLPAAIVGPALIGRGDGSASLTKAVAAVAIGAVIIGAFLPIYQALQGRDLVEFITNERKLQQYLAPGKNPQFEQVSNRFDSIDAAVRQLSRDGNLLLGVGIGNASLSFSEKLTGEYYKKHKNLAPGMVYLSRILWELGLVGVVVYGTLFLMMAIDCLHMRRRQELAGSLALGWIIVSGFMAASFVYFKTFDVNLFGCLYWYFAGYLAGELYRQRQRRLVESRAKENEDTGDMNWTGAAGRSW
ncbi:MAG: hypothetical protein WC383_16895 [Gammaproteobacteria bacterium]